MTAGFLVYYFRDPSTVTREVRVVPSPGPTHTVTLSPQPRATVTLSPGRPTVIIREDNTGRRETVVVVQPSPRPQPTATVTCDPGFFGVGGNCQRGRRP